MSRIWKIRLVLGAMALIAFFLYRIPDAASQVFDLKEVYIDYKSFLPGGTDPLITQNPEQPGKTLGKELNLVVSSDVFRYLYLDFTVHSMTDDNVDGPPGQFRQVGLELGLGVDFRRFWSYVPITVGYYHYSQHLLDTANGFGHFPVQDAIELKLFLYQK